MSWLRTLFRRNAAPPPIPQPEPLPDGWTTSSRQYDAAILLKPGIQQRMARLKNKRITFTPDKRRFTFAAERGEYRLIIQYLKSA